MSEEISIPQMAQYVETDIYDRVTAFHARTNYANTPGLSSRCYLSSASPGDLEKLEFSEVAMWPGIGSVSPLIKNRSLQNMEFLRHESAVSFSGKRGIPFSTVDQLLVDSFCARSEDNRKRPYPSGGALYSIDVFLCRLSENVGDWPSTSNVLHLLPLQKKLEAVGSTAVSELYEKLCGGEARCLGAPYFALVYALFFERAIFKYRYRGYRLALMEAGSMYQIADLCSKPLNLRNRVWAGFSDYQVAKLLGVDLRHMAPLVVQFFGDMDDDTP